MAGLYCMEIESRVTDLALPEVVWGNDYITNPQHRNLDETHDLTDWFDRWKVLELNWWFRPKIIVFLPMDQAA